ncbi:MAG: S1/P1 nuclease [Bacteroidales bacterium]|nr:S1/P1 nuclease [Bacteroidales bacterium]
MNPVSRPSSLLTLFTFCLFTLLPFTAVAWGATAHRAIGEMSESLLTDKAKKEVTAIFGNSSVAMMSIWGDMVRSDTLYDYARTWHYTNLDAELTREAFDTLSVKQNSGEAVYQAMTLTAYLKQNPNDTNMLKMLVHIVQDMHCPMHLGRLEDLGGNRIPIKWFERNTNLHSLWDDIFVDFQKLSYTEYAAHLQRVYPLQEVVFDGNNAIILDWAWETYQTTQIVYDSHTYTEKPYIYNYKYASLLEKRLVTAAEHLAAILNYIYD